MEAKIGAERVLQGLVNRILELEEIQEIVIPGENDNVGKKIARNNNEGRPNMPNQDFVDTDSSQAQAHQNKPSNCTATTTTSSRPPLPVPLNMPSHTQSQRFQKVSDEDTQKIIEQEKNKNTAAKTRSDVNLFVSWLNLAQNETRKLEELSPQDLDSYLAKFYISVRKTDGSQYEPDTLSSIQNSIDRYLMENRYAMKIKTADEFQHSRDVLAAKRKALKKEGKGNNAKKAQSLQGEDLEILYEKGIIGDGNPDSLRYVVWLNNGIHFGLRGRQEHTNLLWGDVELKLTSDGKEFLEYTERATKTRSGAVRGNVRPVNPKMFANLEDPARCPVNFYKLYKGHRPEDMLELDSRFYLRSLDKPKDDIWYTRQPVGKDTLGNYMKIMAQKGGLQGRLVNHSTRKTFATTLREAGISPNEIAQLGGWRNLQSINDYSVPSIKMQETVSKTLSTLSSHKSVVEHNEDKENSAVSVMPTSRNTCPSQFSCQKVLSSATTSSTSDALAMFPGANITGGNLT